MQAVQQLHQTGMQLTVHACHTHLDRVQLLQHLVLCWHDQVMAAPPDLLLAAAECVSMTAAVGPLAAVEQPLQKLASQLQMGNVCHYAILTQSPGAA